MFNSIKRERKREMEEMLRRFNERNPNKPDFTDNWMGQSTGWHRGEVSRGKGRHEELSYARVFENNIRNLERLENRHKGLLRK
jgi:hypothetical protein